MADTNQLKIVRLSDMRECCPERWNTVMNAGQLRGGHIVVAASLIADCKELSAEDWPPSLKQFAIIASLEIILARKRVCESCDWCNQSEPSWLCEHPGCLPCRQRAGGGLKGMIRRALSKCPMKKW
jgi:hypothetical protein